MKTVSLAITALLVFGLAGCSTGIQSPVSAKETAPMVQPVKGPLGYTIDSAFRDRYNALIAIYGHAKLADGAPIFLPSLSKDDGITNLGHGKWLMENEAMVNMAVLSDLKREGFKP